MTCNERCAKITKNLWVRALLTYSIWSSLKRHPNRLRAHLKRAKHSRMQAQTRIGQLLLGSNVLTEVQEIDHLKKTIHPTMIRVHLEVDRVSQASMLFKGQAPRLPCSKSRLITLLKMSPIWGYKSSHIRNRRTRSRKVYPREPTQLSTLSSSMWTSNTRSNKVELTEKWLGLSHTLMKISRLRLQSSWPKQRLKPHRKAINLLSYQTQDL